MKTNTQAQGLFFPLPVSRRSDGTVALFDANGEPVIYLYGNDPIAERSANEIARRARGTPRIAGRLLRRLRDFAHVEGNKPIDRAIADKALGALEEAWIASGFTLTRAALVARLKAPG